MFSVLIAVVVIAITLFILLESVKQRLINELRQVQAEGRQVLSSEINSPPSELQRLKKALSACTAVWRSYYFGTGPFYDFIIGKRLSAQADSCRNLMCELASEIRKREDYIDLVKLAQQHESNRFYQEAFKAYEKAKDRYATQEINLALQRCQDKATQELAYEAELAKAKYNAAQGRTKAAIAILEAALSQFPRKDGEELHQQFSQELEASQYFRHGLQSEKVGDLSNSLGAYQRAIELSPGTSLYKVRLALAAIKSARWDQALAALEGEEGETAFYLRGFTLFQQGNLKQAHKEWQAVTSSAVAEQRETLKLLFKRQRLSSLQAIESAVRQGNLAEAKAVSVKFLKQFGADVLVETNLKEHIRPRLFAHAWKSGEWKALAEATYQAWLRNPNSTTLHNWGVASYYYAQQETSFLDKSISAWATVLANLSVDPSLQSIPWLGSPPDLSDLLATLQRMMETMIDAVKEKDVEYYLKLRDVFRRETTALEFTKDSRLKTPQINALVLTPGCYEQVGKPNPQKLPATIWATLYTRWGLSVAACLLGDVARGIKLKPRQNPETNVEIYAQTYVSYQEGCHYLTHNQWQVAMKSLQPIQSSLKSQPEWSERIDQLCIAQKDKLDEPDERSKFVQSWYELLDSSVSREFHVELKGREVFQKLDQNKISLFKGLEELRKLQRISPKNPLLKDMVSVLEVQQEVEEIDRLMKASRFDEAVQKAKRSSHSKVRFLVAEICIDIALKGAANHNLSAEVILQLGRWAYELCPNEPSFQSFFDALRINRY